MATSQQIAQSLKKLLSSDRYSVTQLDSETDFLNFLKQHQEKVDCLVLYNSQSLQPLINQLYEQGTLLPVVLIEHKDYLSSNNSGELDNSEAAAQTATFLYHSAEVRLGSTQIEEIAVAIEQAIAQFLQLAPRSCLLPQHSTPVKATEEKNTQAFLEPKQRRLSQKLQERLGYLGVYYKRNSKTFFRNLPQDEKEKLLNQLSLEYRQIVLNYFSKVSQVNQAIDQFVNKAFFADISVSQVLEIHMELMDKFAQQLKLEGRSEEILIDCRLVLIDVIAHLCEMYRRSVPREDTSFEILTKID